MLTAIRHLDYAVIICQDMDAMKVFYRDVMGFPIYRDFGQWVEFQVGSVLLTLRERNTGYDGVREKDGDVMPNAASLQLAWRVTPAQVDACYTELVDKGVMIVQEPTNHSETAHRTVFFTDPEHNILEIYADL